MQSNRLAQNSNINSNDDDKETMRSRGPEGERTTARTRRTRGRRRRRRRTTTRRSGREGGRCRGDDRVIADNDAGSNEDKDRGAIPTQANKRSLDL